MAGSSLDSNNPVTARSRLDGRVRRCIDDYEMIEDGEIIAVGVSGGKDSLALLCTLASLREYYPIRFDIHAVTLDMGFAGMDFTSVERLCESLNVPFTLRRKDYGRLIFEERRERNPCSLCAKMRRGALHDIISELGIKKIALAHHFDDAVETFLLCLVYEGRIGCFQPVTYLDRADVTQIRPLLYVEEDMIVRYSSVFDLPVVTNTCPMNGVSKREEIKILLRSLGENYPDIKSKVFGAMKRFPLNGWETDDNSLI